MRVLNIFKNEIKNEIKRYTSYLKGFSIAIIGLILGRIGLLTFDFIRFFGFLIVFYGIGMMLGNLIGIILVYIIKKEDQNVR